MEHSVDNAAKTAGKPSFDGIVNDTEAADPIFDIVKAGTDVLHSDCHYGTFYNKTEEIILKNEHFNKGKTSTLGKTVASIICCKEEDGETEECEQCLDQSVTNYVNSYIKEILKFMAMKIILDNKNIVVMPLTPSDFIKKGWLCLMTFPLTYDNVCKAMGSNSVMDYTSDDGFYDRSPLLSHGQLRLQCYESTLETYAQIYKDDPDPTFWPRLRGQDKSKEGRQDFKDGSWRETVEKFANSLEMIHEAIRNTSCQNIHDSLNASYKKEVTSEGSNQNGDSAKYRLRVEEG